MEGASGTDFALDPDFTTVRLHDVLNNCQTESGASRFARARAIHAEESLEDPLVRFHRNPRAIIANPNLYFAIVQRFATDSYLAFIRPVLDRIFDQVIEHLLQPLRVRVRRKFWRDLIEQPRALLGGPRLQVFKNSIDHFAYFHTLEAEDRAAAFQAR